MHPNFLVTTGHLCQWFLRCAENTSLKHYYNFVCVKNTELQVESIQFCAIIHLPPRGCWFLVNFSNCSSRGFGNIRWFYSASWLTENGFQQITYQHLCLMFQRLELAVVFLVSTLFHYCHLIHYFHQTPIYQKHRFQSAVW